MSNYFKAAKAIILTPDIRAAAIIVIIFFVITGPFGTYDGMSFFERTWFFLPVVLASVPIAGVVCYGAAVAFSHRAKLIQRLVAMIIFVVVSAPLLHWYTVLYAGEGSFSLSAMGPSFLMVGEIAVSILAVLTVIDMEATRRQSNPASPKAVQIARLARRIPDIGDALIARINVDNHHVMVHLNDGQVARILMRFADAVAEMDETPGYITHRSHWVAAAAIDGIVRKNGRDFVRLHDGTLVPLSRSNRASIIDAGIKEVA